MNRRSTSAAIGIAAFVLFSTSGTALGDDRKPQQQFTSVTSKPTELLGLSATGPALDLCNAATGACRLAFLGYDKLDGALTGTMVNAGTLNLKLAAGTGTAVSEATFTGTVAGCTAPGTVAIRWEVVLGAEPGRNVGTFRFVEGSGTGGLGNLRGTGTIVAIPNRATGVITSSGTVKAKC